MSRGGIVVLLSGAHQAATRPLVQTLLDGHTIEDPAAPCVRVCFTPRELLDVPREARVVLVGADADPNWLNLHRPIIRERALTLLLWSTVEQIATLRRFAPDFLDWVSHRIDVPVTSPSRATLELERSLSQGTWLAIAGDELLATVVVGQARIDIASSYDDLLATLDAGDVIIDGVEHERDLWRLMLAHAQTQWSHRVILYEPAIIPPVTPFIDGRPQTWEQRSSRLEATGAREPRLLAALDGDRGGSPDAVPRVVQPNTAVMRLLGAVARQDVDPTTVSRANDLGLHDVADALESITPRGRQVAPRLERMVLGNERAARDDTSKPQITPAFIEQALAGGGDQLEMLVEHTQRVVERSVWRVTRGIPALIGERNDIVQDILLDLFRENGRTLRRWNATTSSLDSWISRVAGRRVYRRSAGRDLPLAPLGGDLDLDGLTEANDIALPHFEQKAEYREALGQIEAFLLDSGKLEDRRRFEAIFVHNREASDVARQEGVSMNTINAWLSRFRRRLQTEFPELWRLVADR